MRRWLATLWQWAPPPFVEHTFTYRRPEGRVISFGRR